jgi:hypothetical protein
MNCSPNDVEEVRDRIKAGYGIYTSESTSLEESKKRVQELGKLVIESFTEGIRERTFAGLPMNTSPSTVAQKKYGADIDKLTDAQIKKGDLAIVVGDQVHDTMFGIMKALKANKKPENKSGIDDLQFNKLVNTGKAMIQWAKSKQEAIDPKGSFEILPEEFLGSSTMQMTGRTDLLILFSNGKAVLFDYKTVGKKSKGKITSSDFFEGQKEEQYNYQILLYKEMLQNDYGIKVMENFLVPIVVDIDSRGKLRSLNSYQNNTDEDDGFLSFIPSNSSETGSDELDKLIDNLHKRIEKVKSRKGKNDKAAINLLKKQLSALNVHKDLTVADSAIEIIKAKYKALKGEKDQFDIQDIDALRDLKEEVQIYTGIEKIYDDVATYHSDKKELREVIKNLNTKAEYTLNKIEEKITEITKEVWISDNDKTEDGKLKKQKKLNFASRMFLSSGSINNSFVKALMNVINVLTDKLSYTMREEKERILKIEKEAVKRVGSTRALYEMLINKEKGRIHSVYSQEFSDEMKRLRELGGTSEVGQEYQKYFEIKDVEQYEKDFFQERGEYQKGVEDELFLQYGKGAKFDRALSARMEYWDNRNDLLNSDLAWSNDYIRHKHTEMREEAKKKYESSEYKRIQSIPEVLAYYEMWTEQMEAIREMLGLDYEQMNKTFIPWFRKDMIDRLGNDFMSIPKEIFKDWTTMREEDPDHFHYVKENGEHKSMPIIGHYPLKNAKGEIDVNEKSYDLTKSLLMFTTSAYQAKFARELEGHALSVRELHKQQGEDLYIKSTKEEKDYRGKVLVDKIDAKYNVDEILGKFIDRHIYGIYTEELINKDIDKGFSKLLDWNSKRLLGMAIVPAVAGGIAAGMQLNAISKKGLYWSKEQAGKADSMLLEHTQDMMAGRKSLAGTFVEVFDLLVESSIDKAIHEANPSLTKKWLDPRSLYMFYRKSDEAIDMKIAMSIAQNYGFNSDGNIKQLKNLPKDTPSVLELFSFNKETGEYSLDKLGSTPEEIASKMGKIRRVVGKIQYLTKGSIPKGESAAYQQNLIAKATMQFKSWMPGVILERFQEINLDETTDTIQIGRYTALGQYVEFDSKDVSFAKKISSWSSIAMHLMYKIINRKHLLESSPEARKALSKSFQNLPQEVQDYFMGNSSNIKVGEEAYKDYLDKQMVAMAQELRWIIGITLAVMMMGMSYGAGDKEKEKKLRGAQEWKDTNWYTRQTYLLARKIGLEIRFAYNPFEILSLSKNAIPVLGIAEDVFKFIGNTFDETGDWFLEEDSSQDKAEVLHYFTLLMYGGRQFRNTVDFIWEVDKKLPN